MKFTRKKNISQDLSQCSDRTRDLNQKLTELFEENRLLQTLIDINTYITNSLERDEVLKRILNQVKVLLKCELSSILLVDRDINRLRFAFFTRDEEDEVLKENFLKMGEGIAGTVWQNGIPIIINDAQNDPRFFNRVDRMSHSVTNSLIAVPLTVNGDIIGVIEAMNKTQGAFSSFDLQMLQYISTQSAIAINNANLYDNAIRDGMTGLFIKKYFLERLNEEWNRAERSRGELSLMFCDIDCFKGINDTYGHLAGDRVLKDVAEVIKKNSRSIDIPCRYGGEEFILILPDASNEEAHILAERIRTVVEKLKVYIDGNTITLTISVGISSLKLNEPTAQDDFIKMADKALYASKEAGRNRVSMYQASMGER